MLLYLYINITCIKTIILVLYFLYVSIIICRIFLFQHQYHTKSDEFLEKVQTQMMKSVIEKVKYSFVIITEATQYMSVRLSIVLLVY